MSFMMSVLRGLILTIFVVLTPLSLTNLLEYLLTLGFEIPWPLDMIFVPMLTFITLLLITFLFKLWFVIQECPNKKKDYGGIFWAAVWSPFLAMAGSLVMDFVPFLKIPFLAAEVLGELIHPFFSKVPEGLTYLPGHFFGLIITSIFGKMMMGC
jgi:hypothetical protein